MKKTLLAIGIVMALTACNSNNNTNENTDSVAVETAQNVDINGHWNIEKAMSQTTENGETAPFIEFNADGEMNGNTSVNLFSSSYVLEGENLKFGDIAMTKRMGASMEIEDAVIQALNSVASIAIDGSQAYVMNADNDTIMVMTKGEMAE